MPKKYRLPRKEKKAQKASLLLIVKQDLGEAGLKLTNSKKRSMRYTRRMMASVVYHSYVFTK